MGEWTLFLAIATRLKCNDSYFMRVVKSFGMQPLQFDLIHDPPPSLVKLPDEWQISEMVEPGTLPLRAQWTVKLQH